MNSLDSSAKAFSQLSAGDGLKFLDIRTKTVEFTLFPLLQQITQLVNRKSESSPSHNGHSDEVGDVSCSVQAAISEFINAGEKVAVEYPSIEQQMLESCRQAYEASEQILSKARSSDGRDLVAPMKKLLATMYKVLILADSVIVGEIVQAKDKVITKLDFLTKVSNFTDFLDNFTSFGAEMAEFGKVTGERQLDMKKEMDASKMACLRSFLEKSTAIYLTACKICLRHPTNTLSRDIRSTVVDLMKKGLSEIIDIVCYAATANTDDHEKILCRALTEHSDALEMCAILSGDATSVNKARESFLLVDEYVHEFTDSAYTPHEHRELIILTCQKCKEEVDQLCDLSMAGDVRVEDSIAKCQSSTHNLRRQLIQHTLFSAAELFGSSVDTGLLAALRSAAQEGNNDVVENIASQIRDHADHIQEVSRQMQHVSPTDSFYIRVKYTASYLLSLTELLLQSAEVFCCHGMSKAAAEGYSTMADSWVMLIGELAAASEELQDSLYQTS